MAAKKRGLGRGLDALLGAQASSEASDAGNGQSRAPAKEAVTELPVEDIQRGKYQPRRDMQPEALEELAQSIKSQGLMQPIVVRPIGKEGSLIKYEIIAGERRWRATQLAGLPKIPVIVKDVPDEAAIAMALIENIQREDLNPMEEALALERLQSEFDLSHGEIGKLLGKSRSTISNLLRLTSLRDDVQKMLEHGDLEMGHARCLLALTPDNQIKAANTIVARSLSVRQTEAMVRRMVEDQSSEKAASEPPKVDADIKQLQDDLSQKLGAGVQVQHSAKGKGKLVISYNNLDELDGILAHIK